MLPPDRVLSAVQSTPLFLMPVADIIEPRLERPKTNSFMVTNMIRLRSTFGTEAEYYSLRYVVDALGLNEGKACFVQACILALYCPGRLTSFPWCLL